VTFWFQIPTNHLSNPVYRAERRWNFYAVPASYTRFYYEYCTVLVLVEVGSLQCPGAYNVPLATFLSYRRSILRQTVGYGCFSPRRGARGRLAATPPRLWGFPDPGLPLSTAKVLCLWAASGASIISGAAWRASFRGDRQMVHERKLKVASRCYKVVRNARGDANCARAQEGGGRGEAKAPSFF